MNRGHKQTDLIKMDFARAFDKVLRRSLLHKLDYYGIRGATHKWINSWLSGRTQQVILHGQASDPVGVSTQLQSSGLVAHENSTFRNLALAVSGPFMA